MRASNVVTYQCRVAQARSVLKDFQVKLQPGLDLLVKLMPQ